MTAAFQSHRQQDMANLQSWGMNVVRRPRFGTRGSFRPRSPWAPGLFKSFLKGKLSVAWATNA